MEAALKELAKGGPYALVMAIGLIILWRVWWPHYTKREEERAKRDEQRHKDARDTLKEQQQAHERQMEQQNVTHKVAWDGVVRNMESTSISQREDMRRITGSLERIDDKVDDIKREVSRKQTRRLSRDEVGGATEAG